MSASLEWDDSIASDWHEKALKALHDGGEKIITKANNEETPWSSGQLGGSANIEDQDNQVILSFNTPYARRQHEEMLRHPNPAVKHAIPYDKSSGWVLVDPLSQAGRKDHYLRDPCNDLWSEIVDDIAAALLG